MKQNASKTIALVLRCLALGLSLGVLTLLGMDKISQHDALWLLALAVTVLSVGLLGELSDKNKKK